MSRQVKKQNMTKVEQSGRTRSTRSKVVVPSSESDDTEDVDTQPFTTQATVASLSEMNLSDDDDDEPMPSTSRAVVASSSRSQSESSVLSSTGNKPKRTGAKKEIRKQFSTLIEKCQEFEEKEGFDKTMEQLMSKNIGKGQQLFDEIGGGPGDMFLAFMHTRICSGMLKVKTANIGSNTSAFKVDLFLSSLLEKCVAADGEFEVGQVVKCISATATDCCRTLNPMVAIVGSFEQKPPQDATASKEKEKKQRATVRKRQFDESTVTQATHRELMTKMNADQRQPTQKTSHESISKGILAVLHTSCRSTPDRSMNIFEFILDPNSFANTIESLFYVAFLVRDGEVNFFRHDNQPNHDYTISIKPDSPPKPENINDKVEKKKKKRNTVERSQFILSFSVKQWKELCALSSGENIIAEHKRKSNNGIEEQEEEEEEDEDEEMEDDDDE